MNRPRINIRRAYLLEPIFINAIKAVQGQSWRPLNEELITQRIKEFNEDWDKESKIILEGMSTFLNLEFAQKDIEVYVVPGIDAFSDPLVIGSNIKRELSIDILTHELIHRLLTVNTKELDVKTIWDDMFPDTNNRIVRNHVLVHAVHKHLYLDILKDKDRYTADLDRAQRSPAYKEAWEVVNNSGYKEIVEVFQKHY